MAQNAEGSCVIKFMNGYNESFNEKLPFYIKYNFLKDDETSVNQVKECFVQSIGKLSGLTSNSFINAKVTYEVNIL